VITVVFSALATTSTFQGFIYLLLVGIPASEHLPEPYGKKAIIKKPCIIKIFSIK
jgi:hypothetical protein